MAMEMGVYAVLWRREILDGHQLQLSTQGIMCVTVDKEDADTLSGCVWVTQDEMRLVPMANQARHPRHVVVGRAKRVKPAKSAKSGPATSTWSTELVFRVH